MRYTEENIDRGRYSYGQYGRAEFFIANVLSRSISFDRQPYTRGKGKIVAITPREISIKIRHPQYGSGQLACEVYDIEIEVEQGSHNGAFLCGVPVSAAKDIAGTIETISGMTHSDLHRAVFGEQKTHVIATCG